MRGRKPKPTALKLLAGNPGKRALNKHEPQFPRLTHADAPAWLDDLGREMWNWLAPHLIEKGVATEVDLHNLEAFCCAYARWRMAEAAIRQHGLTLPTHNGQQKNPAVTVANEAMRQMTLFGSTLGLDPVSRSRIKVPGGPTQNPFTSLDG